METRSRLNVEQLHLWAKGFASGLEQVWMSTVGKMVRKIIMSTVAKMVLKISMHHEHEDKEGPKLLLPMRCEPFIAWFCARCPVNIACHLSLSL